jgi:thiamine-phosphate pyrophosphorylase
MFLYYITDRRQFPGSREEQRAALLGKISEAAGCGVDYIQLREKDLSAREQLQLAQDVLAAISAATAEAGNRKLDTRLLINSRLDIALVSGAHGVHLRSDDISAAEARAVIAKAGNWKPETRNFLVAVSCHTPADVRRAASEGADLAVFAPVFEKSGRAGVGLEALRAACLETAMVHTPEPSSPAHIPVLALGGVTVENTRSCLQTGAAGIAAIRLFQENNVAEVVARLRKLATDRPKD